MGWKFSVLHLAPAAAHLVELGEEQVIDAAGERDAWARASDAGLTIISRSTFEPDTIDDLASKTDARIVHTVFSSVASVYLFEVYEGGTQVRRILKLEDVPEDTAGAPLPRSRTPTY